MSEKKDIRNKEFIIIAICFINLLMLLAINISLDYFNSVDEPDAGIMVYRYETYDWRPNTLFYSVITGIAILINGILVTWYMTSRLLKV